MRTNVLFMVLMMSFSALAQVSDNSSLEQALAQEMPEAIVDTRARDLEYAKQNLSIEERTQRELALLTESVRNEVQLQYNARIQKGDDAQAAFEEIRENINTDIELADPAYREELRRLALGALDDVHLGNGLANEILPTSLESVIQKNVEERAEYLSAQAVENNNQGENFNNNLPSTSRAKDAEKRSYNNVQEVISSLISDRENTKWVSTGAKTADIGDVFSREASVNIQLKFKFLGTGISGGPVITFTRRTGTNAMLQLEGQTNPILDGGTIDFWKRDFNGNILKSKGEPVRRFGAFYCSVWTELQSTYRGEATLSVDAGVASLTEVLSLDSYRKISSATNSRRIYIPDTIGNKIVNINMISQICNSMYPNAKVQRGVSIKDADYMMLRNMIKNLSFSHPKTKCATDAQCVSAFRKTNFSASVKAYLSPRCVEHPVGKYRYCENRGLENTYCDVFDKNGKSVAFQRLGGYTKCDNGLKCVVTSPATYVPGTSWLFKAAAAVCKPVNPSSYRRPVK